MEERKRVVLLGAGHANLQVLQGLVGYGVETVLVSEGEVAVYSGMVPGVICGEYRPEEAMVQLGPLAVLCGAEFVPIRAVRLDPHSRIVTLEGGRTIAYDVLSVDIGSRSKGTDVPGVREHCLMTRPLIALIKALEGLDRRETPPKVVVVGAGAAGVELAFTFLRRFQAHFGPSFSLSLIHSTDTILPGFPVSTQTRTQQLLHQAGISLLLSTTVAAVHSSQVHLSNGQVIPADVTIWAAGAEPHDIALNVPLCKDGFMRVNQELQSVAFPEVFGGGDCISIEGFNPGFPPKAGVYAVREGPIIAKNIIAMLEKRPLTTYWPQQGFLTLLNVGNGQAIGTKYGYSFSGTAVRRLKDSIDRKFMRKFDTANRQQSNCALF